MAATPDSQPDHPLLRGLDKAFTGAGGNAPALVGWLSYLAHPEEHDGPRLVRLTDSWNNNHGEKEARTKPLPVNPRDTGGLFEVDAGSILRDLEGRLFFAHADVLSGQNIGELNDAGDGLTKADAIGETSYQIEEVRHTKRPSSSSTLEDSQVVWNAMVQYSSGLFQPDVWGGTTAEAAECRYLQMVNWYTVYRERGLRHMNELLTRYAAIMFKARQDINELMGKLVTSLKDWAETDEGPPPGFVFALSLLGKIATFAVDPEPVSKALIAYDGVVSIIDEATKRDDSEFGYKGDKADGCYRMLESYLKAGNQVCELAADAVDRLINDPDLGVGAVRGSKANKSWVDVPDWTVPCVKPGG